MTEYPPFWSAVAATALISGFSGYYLATLAGFNSTITLWSSESPRRGRRASQGSSSSRDSQDSEASEEEEGPAPEGPLPDSAEEHKLVLVVRTDLGMGKGKIAAQCGHASLACYKRALKYTPKAVSRWETFGQAKIALKSSSEEEILVLQATAISLGLVAEVIHDAGRTQIAAGSATVLGIGPGPKSLVNQVTGHLSLL